MEHEVKLEVDAPPERVWDLFVAVDRWPEWTKSVTKVERLDEATFGIGSRARIKQPRLMAAVWQVTDFQPGAAFTWESNSPGVTTSAVHHVAAGSDGGSVITLSIEQTGALAGVIGLVIGGMARRYVQMEAEGFKRQAETAAAGE